MNPLKPTPMPEARPISIDLRVTGLFRCNTFIQAWPILDLVQQY